MKTRRARYNPPANLLLSMATGPSMIARPALLALMAATVSAAVPGPPRTFDTDPVGRPPAGLRSISLPFRNGGAHPSAC